ncbi:transcriptional regulator [Mycolicibacterium sp. ND9-15]|nr:transcriptional regulator [Mycolicibacterium sp. ND9-15]WSE58865.1 transcriptional regulator [Mycolicibacterium sp. ND9-15]
MVREHGDAVDALELAAEIGAHVTTVRFHLDSLCDEGAIVRTRLPRAGKGRPRTGYRAVQQRVDYRILAEILAMELGRNVHTRARRAQHAGRKWAARMATPEESDADAVETSPATHADDVLDRAAVRTTVAFTGMGFAPELVARTPPVPRPERIIRLHACPVRDLARTRPEVVCEIHRGLLEGLVAKTPVEECQQKSRGPALSARLEPFVEPELCVARLVSGK